AHQPWWQTEPRRGSGSVRHPDRSRRVLTRRAASWPGLIGGEQHGPERGNGDGDRLGVAVRRNRAGSHAAEVTLAAAAIYGRVAVEDLAPPAEARYADDVVVARYGREVEGSDDLATLSPPPAEKGHHALLGVVGVDPGEALRIEVAFVQGRQLAVEAIEVLDQPLDAVVGRVLKQIPLHAAVVVPLLPLPELSAHKQELLSRLGPHVG